MEQAASEKGKDTRQRILQAAMEVFCDKGRDGARMHEIADRAGVNQALLHYYFSTKEGLYEEMLYTVFSKIMSDLIPVLLGDDDRDPRLKIEGFVDTYIDFIAGQPLLPPIMMRELAGGAGTILKVVSRIFAEKQVHIPEGFVEVVETGIKDGKLREVDPVQAVVSVIGMSLFYFVGRPLISLIWNLDHSKEDEFIEARKEHIKDLLRHGLFLRSEEI